MILRTLFQTGRPDEPEAPCAIGRDLNSDELREQALRARRMVRSILDPELRSELLRMADKLDAEADRAAPRNLE
jgi:hypothetical protein